MAAFSLLLLFLQLFQGKLLFQRQLIADGQIWRLWTGNLVHTNLWHLGANLSGLWLLTMISPTLSRPTRQFGAEILFISTCTGLGLWFLSPELVWYTGFSGILYGLFTLAGVRFAFAGEWLMSLVILLGLCGKTAWDWLHGSIPLTANLIGTPVAYVAHIYGMGGGAMLAMLEHHRPR